MTAPKLTLKDLKDAYEALKTSPHATLIPFTCANCGKDSNEFFVIQNKSYCTHCKPKD